MTSKKGMTRSTRPWWKIPMVVVVILVVSGLIFNAILPYQAFQGIGELRPALPQAPTTVVVTMTTTAAPAFASEKGGETEIRMLSSERMVIYTAQVTVEVKDISKAEDEIIRLALSLGGYVAGSSISSLNGQKSGYVAIRVPRESFDQALDVLDQIGEVKSKSTSSEDITEQYIDLKARLKNLQAQERILTRILNMSKTVQDVLDVQRELERVRGEIESLIGRINYLERNVEMSLINVRLIEPTPPTEIKPPTPDWGEVFNTALFTLYSIVRGLIILIFGLIPFIVVGVPLAYIFYRRSRRQDGTQTK